MKKLMIAMAIAGAVGFAQAGLNTTNADFESENLGMFNIGSGEGTEWAAAAEDMDGGSVTTAIVTNDTPAAEVGGSQYLKLDGVTELARNANSEDYTQPYEIGSGKVYIDTLVKFTITEDDAPVPGDGDKLCIWVKENGGTTNLMVTAGYVDAQMNTTATNYITSYTFDGDLNNTWYRLIVEVIPGIDQEGIFQGFKISVGEAGSSLTLVTSTESKYACSDSPLTETESEIFPSLFDINSKGQETTTKISSVAFKGTGAIDNLQFTTNNPAPAQADWVDPTVPEAFETITNKPVSEVYAAVAAANPALAAVDAGKLTVWAKSVGDVDFGDATTANSINADCFLLNIANDSTAEEIEDAKDDFVLTITFDNEGNPVVELSEEAQAKGYNVTPVIKGATTLQGPDNWHNKTDGDKFFKAVLELPSAD